MSTETFSPEIKVSIPVRFENVGKEADCKSMTQWMNITFFTEYGSQAKMKVGDLIVNINPKSIIEIMFLFTSNKDIDSILKELKLIR